MKTVATIEARMTSSRLPGKPLLPAADLPMLGHLIRRLQTVSSLQGIVLATTINCSDDPLATLAEKMGVEVYRGSEDDVLARVIGAAEQSKADTIVEITGDCPIIDPDIIEQIVQIYIHNDADYVSNANERSYPDGMDVQVFSLATLKRSAALTSDPLDHEHVTLHIKNNPKLFSQINVIAPPEICWPELGLTLDEEDDYILIKAIIEHFYSENPLFSCLDVVRYLRRFPELVSINDAVIRKHNE